MSKRNKKLKQFMETTHDEWDTSEDHFSAPKGKKPKSRVRKKSAKRAYYD